MFPILLPWQPGFCVLFILWFALGWTRLGHCQAGQNAIGISKNGALENDARLLKKVTISRKKTTVAQALGALTRLTKVKMQPGEKEVALTELSFHYRATPLKDILESMALLRNWEWKRVQNVLLLREHHNPHQLDVFRPHSELQAAQSQKVREFIEQLKQLPPALQMSIQTVREEGRSGILFRSLPEGMQHTLQQALEFRLQERTTMGRPSIDISPDNLEDAYVYLQINQQEAFTGYSVTISTDRHDMGLSTTVFKDPREGYHIVPALELTSTLWFGAEEDEKSRQEALMKDPRLSTKITLRLRSVTLPTALKELAEQTGISFVAEGDSMRGALKRSFFYENMPLSGVLDHLAAQYRYTWGWTKGGIFLFHAAPPDEEEKRAFEAKVKRFLNLQP